MNKKDRVLYVAILFVILIYLVPFLFMLFLSFKPVGSPMGSELLRMGGFTARNYQEVFHSGLYTRYLLNGLTVAVSSALLAIVIGFFSAYALSRFVFPLKEKLFIGMIAIKAMPPVLMCVAFFSFAVKTKLYDTLWILILLDTIFNVPLTIIMLRNFMDAVPKELDEASQIDGCPQWYYLLKVMLPLTRSGLAAVFVQCFLLSWNEYMYAVLFINGNKYKMPTVAIYDFIGQWSTNYIGIVTFAVLLSMPVIVAFIAVQKHFVKGMLAGSEK